MSIKKFISSLRRFAKQEDGVASVEFSLTFPIYLGVVILVVEIARVIFTYAVVMHSAEEATRYALVNYDASTTDISDYAKASLLGLDPDNLVAIVVTAPLDTSDNTKLITVEVKYNYIPILPVHKFPGWDNEDGFSVSGSSKGFLTEEIPSSS